MAYILNPEWENAPYKLSFIDQREHADITKMTRKQSKAHFAYLEQRRYNSTAYPDIRFSQSRYADVLKVVATDQYKALPFVRQMDVLTLLAIPQYI